MVSRIACVLIFLAASLTVSETVFGVSSPFSFARGIGINNRNVPLKSFTRLQSRLLKNGTVQFTWSMKGTTGTGILSIYSLSGRRIKTIPVISANGLLKLDANKERLSNGIYFATLEAGTLKQKVKFTIF